jgi:FkbM family methyltransferase
VSGSRIAGAEAVGRGHDQIFQRFRCWEGKVPDGFIVNFLGVMTRACYWQPNIALADAYPTDRYVRTEYPPFDEEYFEWTDLLEAVIAAQGHFTMLELGGGWGRWTANAAFALRQINDLPHTLIAVEAEPTHFQWMVQHLADNSVDPNSLRLIQAAVDRADGKVGFPVGETAYGGPDTWYGQSIGGQAIVEAVSLGRLLEPLETVDLMDLDIQGAEFGVLEAAASMLDQKVKRVHVETHSERIDEALRSLFRRLGWKCLHCFVGGTNVDTEWGVIHFQDGVQSWLNPTYFTNSRDHVAVLENKLEVCRREGARLWVEFEKIREERDRLLVQSGPLTLKLLSGVRRLRDRIAPLGTQRRRISDRVTTKFKSGAKLGDGIDF